MNILVGGRHEDISFEEFSAVEFVQGKDLNIHSDTETPNVQVSRTIVTSQSQNTHEQVNRAGSDPDEPCSVDNANVSLPCVPLLTLDGLKRLTLMQGSAKESAKTIRALFESNKSTSRKTNHMVEASAYADRFG